MKKVIYAVLILAAFVAMFVVMFNNQAKSEAEKKKVAASTEVGAVAVRVAQVQQQTLTQPLTITGTVAALADVTLMAETSGRIIRIYAKNGDYLAQGAVLAIVDSELVHANLLAAEANYTKTKRDLERFENLLKQEATTDATVEGARLAYKTAEANYIMAKRRLRDCKITMPFGGIVANRLVDVGSMLVSVPPTPLANIIDVSAYKVKVNLAEEDVVKLRLGDRAEVTSAVFPGQTFWGNVYSISAKADEAHTYPVEILVPNNGYVPLKAGMFARTTFKGLGAGSSLTVPREALVGSVKSPKVYVVEGGKAVLRPIVIKSEVGALLAISEGLKAGEQVITSGLVNLTNNSEVRIIQ